MDKAIYRCMTEATTSEGENIRHSLNWVTARRAMLKVMPDALICGDWMIPYEAIDEAILFSVWSVVPGFLLRVRAGETIYQFGLNWNPFWRNELPFPVIREKGWLRYSAFSIAVRVLLLGYIVYWIWRHFKG